MKKPEKKTKPTRGRARPHSFLLLKSKVGQWQDALAEGKQDRPPEGEELDGLGTLVLKDTTERKPWWVDWLSPYSKRISTERQRSPGAVLFVRENSRMFALPFGYGRSLIAPDTLEHDFGIRVVLNEVDPARLHSIDMRTLEVDPLVSRKQVGDGRPLASFGVDRYRDILRGVAGSPGPNQPLLKGSDAVQLRIPLRDAEDVHESCRRLLSSSRKTRYKEHFGFIDQIRLIRDPDSKRALEEKLYEACLCGASEARFMLPDIVEPQQLDALRSSWRRDTLVSSDAVRARLAGHAGRDDRDRFRARIRADRIGLPSEETGSWIRSWALRDCLLWTTEPDRKRYILSAGDWFELDGDFVTAIERDFDDLVRRPPPLSLPAATALRVPDRSYFEHAYNQHAASSTPGLRCLDRTNQMTGTGAGAIEPCDLLDANRGMFIHVKQGRDAASLSHLFMQGSVALDSFLDTKEARAQVRKLAGLTPRGDTRMHDIVDPQKLTVVFAIIDAPPKSGRLWRLPFFSMLSAKHAVEQIARRQVQARIIRIDDLRKTRPG